MRQLVYLGPGRVEWQEGAEPVLRGAGEALVRPLAVARCDLDAAMMMGLAPYQGPFPLGHEFVGEVVAAGDDVEVSPGKRVIVSFQICCGECSQCSRGFTGSCQAAQPGAMYGVEPLGGPWGGALADIVRVPFANSMMVELPDGIAAADVASLSDNVADGWRAVGPQLAARPGAPVLVMGGLASSVGLYAVACGVALGAERVDYLDTDEERLKLAAVVGANPIAGPPPRKAGSYPITVDASSNPDGLSCAILSTEANGVCTSVAIYFAPPTMPLLQMYTKGITFLTGRVNSRAAIPPVLELVTAGRLKPQLVTGMVASWEDADRVFGERVSKVVFARD
jgi:alcohol dehydrogenase